MATGRTSFISRDSADSAILPQPLLAVPRILPQLRRVEEPERPTHGAHRCGYFTLAISALPAATFRLHSGLHYPAGVPGVFCRLAIV